MVKKPLNKSVKPAKSGRGSALLVFVLVLAGTVSLLYPTASSWVAQYEQSRLIAHGVPDSRTEDRSKAQHELALARAYNDDLHAGASYRANTNQPVSKAGKDQHEQYLKALDAGNGLMARLQIPGIRLDLPVYHGTSDDTLLQGIGHLEGTSLPVGGQGTHAVLTGHRGLATATMFTNLNQVKEGDRFTLSSFGEVLTYEVVRTQVVDPDQTRSLKPVEGQDLVTLVTCTPLGVNTQRIFVTGQRIYPTPEKDKKAAAARPTIPDFPYWTLIIAAVFLGDTYWLYRNLKTEKHSVLTGEIPAGPKHKHIRRATAEHKQQNKYEKNSKAKLCSTQ
ncbi:hypothetical protein KIMH_02860 [Bombiscardovia apis]|uniref:Sortase n=1 Tax=Bombiscardovia apis TaxID=2932182 RepID=A0ABM8BB91_9BIFI|nr:class C sortase [Bombiscardovia apis]BDR54175.1 hypothetical protein KIMH_02860 [Bombiscardovia apis]